MRVFRTVLSVLFVSAFIFTTPAQTPPRLCLTPPSGLVDWWPFDEAATPAATTAQDIAGAVNNFTTPFLFGPTPVAGMVSNALSFDGVNDFWR